MVKFGIDKDLEKLADQLLRDGVGENKRSVSRDTEKMSYEKGFISRGELREYDPTNDWDVHDSPTAIVVISPGDLIYLESSICADVDDGNTRAMNRTQLARSLLNRHVRDEDDWGSAGEDIPLLGVNDGPRKTCTKCRRPRGVRYFSPDTRNRDGLHSWCKECRKKNLRHKK